MPKPRRGQGKHSSQGRRERRRQVAPVAAPREVPGRIQPAKPPVATPEVAQYPYIAIELRNIGMVTGVVLVILVVLRLVLG